VGGDQRTDCSPYHHEPVLVDTNPGLLGEQKAELQHLIGQFSDLFSSVPRQTSLVHHDIITPPRVIVKCQPYLIPEARQQVIEDEIQQMLKLGVIEPSRILVQLNRLGPEARWHRPLL